MPKERDLGRYTEPQPVALVSYAGIRAKRPEAILS